MCYQIPILDDLVRDSSPGLRAIIIYPMNALVNDQLSDWERKLKMHPKITFARFTGQTPNDQKTYVDRLKAAIKLDLSKQQLNEQELYRETERRLNEKINNDIPNRLNHREAIRKSPPNILITNFSMLEYLLERPIDASIFYNARLKFLVLDEAHAYRGVQATEIAFLIRRLKDRLGIENIVSIATSATLGERGNKDSEEKVRKFVSGLFDADFPPPNPIYGEPLVPKLSMPSVKPQLKEYISAIEALRSNPLANWRTVFNVTGFNDLADFLSHDENLYLLRTKVLASKPKLLKAAAVELWGEVDDSEEGLQALLELVALAKADQAHEDLLPTRLHYFVKAQDGFFVCLNQKCPGRVEGQPAYFQSRKASSEAPEGNCPFCFSAGVTSRLVELVTCRKCGYLYGALQDLGPKRKAHAEMTGGDECMIEADSFDTELGWAADSFWTYFSVDGDLPYPREAVLDEDEEESDDLKMNPVVMEWCTTCAKRVDKGAGDVCHCGSPSPRLIKIFHRQCPHSGRAQDRKNLENQVKKLLTSCPNCGARNGSGLEPVRRFQESDDETGIAMAIPLAHFQVAPIEGAQPKKLLCFTDHRQRAAAFPSLIEEEIFTHDFGRKILQILDRENKPLDFVTLGELLNDASTENARHYDPQFFLPVSRFSDNEDDLNARGKRNLWIAEVFGYFGIPDAARESLEDLGLVKVEYTIGESDRKGLNNILEPFGVSQQGAYDLLQVLLCFIRNRKGFTLPPGILPDSPAFGRITGDLSYVLKYQGTYNTLAWLPKNEETGENYVTSYLQRALNISDLNDVRVLAEKIWRFLTDSYLLIRVGNSPRGEDLFKLSYERLLVKRTNDRYICNKCGIISAYSVNSCCPRKGCKGPLQSAPYTPAAENLISRWVSGTMSPQFRALRTEEHSAQIDKELAKIIEESFRSAEGVNLLSSTTTFEMGINIGDLQKVLLRNAPPASASYVQRVGRAGRGRNKNAVCVTLCRRTKYDADSWVDPTRLMSGAVKTPAVFLLNSHIAQRHFNAVVFAQFLKIKLGDQKVLGPLGQSIKLKPFLPLEVRSSVPPGLSSDRVRAVHLDFSQWLSATDEGDVFSTRSGRSILQALRNFSSAKNFGLKKYQEITDKIAEELKQLLWERRRLYDLGQPIVDIDKAVKSLLDSSVVDVLARRGFLPRYAFPLDTVTLETGWSRWSRDTDVELSRERGIAIAEFAPGAQVVAHKKVFTSSGLYIVSKMDVPERMYFSRCNDCGQIRTDISQEKLKGKCEICGRLLSSNDVRVFVEPNSFSVTIDKKKKETKRFGRGTLIRQRQSITHFIDSVSDAEFKAIGDFQIATKEMGALFKYNLGAANQGFVLCPQCGFSDARQSVNWSASHLKLRAFSKDNKCANEHFWRQSIAYGHRFQSFCAIIRSDRPWQSVESAAFAIKRAMCAELDVDVFDIGVSWRRRSGAGKGAIPEIVLYDQAPGGSGFVKEALNIWPNVVVRVAADLRSCECERACYDCLKDYSNQAFHELLDRKSVIDLFSIS